MQKKINKKKKLSEKIIDGMILARKKMLEEKSIKGGYVVYSENGKIKKESAKIVLARENKK
jgi:hypothetical protein